MPLRKNEYDEWSRYHASLFWMHSEADQQLFGLWFQLLSEFELAELKEASTWMAGDDDAAKSFRTQHVARIRQRIFNCRRANKERRDQEMEERETKTTARFAISDSSASHTFARSSMVVGCIRTAQWSSRARATVVNNARKKET